MPSMTVAQNLELGMEKLITVYSKINIAATQSQQSLNFNVDPLTLVENLGTAKRQMVEIVRAVRHNAKVFIFDEPTASLTPEETQHLFHLLNTLRERGAGIIFISHALEEALNIADRITVLRDGRLVSTSRAKDMTRDALVRMMIGRDVTASHYARHGADPASPRAPAKARGKGALGRECHDGRGRQEHVLFRLLRRGCRHLRSGRRRSDGNRADHLRRAQAQLPARRHDLPEGQAGAIPRAATSDPRRHRLHHRGPEGRWFLRDHDGRPEHLSRVSVVAAHSTLLLFARGR